MIRFTILNLLLFACQWVLAQDGIPSKTELDRLMSITAKQVNEQMAGSRMDENTTLKFVVYDRNPSPFTYFYSSTVLSYFNLTSLNQTQVNEMRKYYTSKACSATYRFMKPYNMKVAHIVEDNITGKIIFKVTISHTDC